MAGFDEYADRYTNLAMVRSDEGILHVRFHTDGGAFRFGAAAHTELEHAFREIGRDRANKVIVMSGTGEDFCAEIDLASWGLARTATGATIGGARQRGAEFNGAISWEGRQFVLALLDIEAPIIAAVHGRCVIHCEIPLLSDVVLASETARFGDDAHLPSNAVPGDGIQILWTTLLGPNRGRYLQFVHEILDAREAHRLGVVGEVLAPDQLMDRAWGIARHLAGKRSQVLRNTRLACTRSLRKAFDDALVLGFGLEMAAIDDAALASTDAS
jgi:enoyl-CoA hydratase/carnithine racemase